MAEYYVSWRMDVTADSVNEAVLKAVEIMRDPESIATWFTVFDEGGTEIANDDFYDIIYKEEAK